MVIQMKNKKKALILAVLLTAIFLLVVLWNEVMDGLACLAYYDQCTAQRVEGLTKEECLERDDVVAFLYTGEICLVEKK